MKIIDGKPSAAVEPYDFTIDPHGKYPTRCRVTEIDYQRNGVGGQGFWVLRFQCSESPEAPLVGIVFDYDPEDPNPSEYYNPATAVLSPDDLTRHWRGDNFNEGLRDAIAARRETIWSLPTEVDA